MMCKVCGFDDEKKSEDPFLRMKFIPLMGTFIANRSETYQEDLESVDLIICPSCGTVKCSAWWCNPRTDEKRNQHHE